MENGYVRILTCYKVREKQCIIHIAFISFKSYSHSAVIQGCKRQLLLRQFRKKSQAKTNWKAGERGAVSCRKCLCTQAFVAK